MTSAVTQNDVFNLPISKQEFDRAKKSIPGGLVSHIRKRDNQVVFSRAQGAYLWDVDGNRYIDCVLAHGPILLGHALPVVNEAVKLSLDNGVQFGGANRREADLAELALKQIPYAGKVTFMSTGTEAVQLAIRLARTATGRKTIVKFQGHYHGWIDPMFVNVSQFETADASSRLDAESSENDSLPVRPETPGAAAPEGVVVTTWNDLEQLEKLMGRIGEDVAAVIMEPLITGFGNFMPAPGYLEGLKSLCHRYGALVIFDEVVTGFRISPSGASGILGVTPDIGTFAKGIANGYPMSMVAGTNSVMSCIEDGRVSSAGTYSGTPASMEAGIATLTEISNQGGHFYAYLNALGQQLKEGLEQAGRDQAVPILANQIGSLVQVLWGEIEDPHSMDGVYKSNKHAVAQVCEKMITKGIYMSRKGLFYLSRAHTQADIEEIIRVFEDSLKSYVSDDGVIQRSKV